MGIATNRGRPRSEIFRHLQKLSSEATDECQFCAYPVRSVAWGGTSKTPHWISTYLVHGSKPSPELVPVRLCGVRGCINGRHFKWGTQDEAQAARVFPSRQGEKNPRAKVSDEKLRELRARDWGNGSGKVAAAKELGISPRSLNALLRGWSRPEIKSKDEF